MSFVHSLMRGVCYINLQDFRNDVRFTNEALLSIQEAAEAYIARMFQHAQTCAVHAKRITIQPKDIALVLKLCGDPI
jgi:histone H3/H4